MQIVGLIIMLVVILLMNLTTVIITNKTFGRSLPLTLLGLPIPLFLFGLLFKTFYIGIVIDILYGLYSIFYLIKNRKKKRREGLEEIKNNYFSNGFFIFITFFAIIALYDWNREFCGWDDRAHWGPMIKEMLRLDKFYYIDNSMLQSHKEYPPFLQLFEFFFARLSGGYYESNIISSLHLLEASLFIPFIEGENRKNKFLTVLFGILSLLIIFNFTLVFDLHNGGIINLIYNDYFMAILIAYGVGSIIFFSERTGKFTIVNLLLTTLFLVMTKEIAIVFVLMILFLYCLYLIFDNEIGWKKIVLVILGLFAVPVLFSLLWGACVKNVNTPVQFNTSEIELNLVLSIIKNETGYGVQNAILNSFKQGVYSFNISNTDYTLTYLSATVLFIILLVVLWSKNKLFDTKHEVSLIVTLIIGAVGYAAVMLLTYLFCFKGTEASGLTSFDRYMVTYVLVIVYVFITYLYMSYHNDKRIALLLIPLAISVILASPKGYNRPVIDNTYFKEHGEVIKEAQLEAGSKVFFVEAANPIYSHVFVPYYAGPIISNNEFSASYSYDFIKKYFDECEYIYIVSLTEELYEEYVEHFGSEVNIMQLYKINKNGEDYSFELINEG